MVNGVQNLAGVWPRFSNASNATLLCHGPTCDLAAAATNASRLIRGKKCHAYSRPRGIPSIGRGQHATAAKVIENGL